MMTLREQWQAENFEGHLTTIAAGVVALIIYGVILSPLVLLLWLLAV
jgi:hypothetical protein